MFIILNSKRQARLNPKLNKLFVAQRLNLNLNRLRVCSNALRSMSEKLTNYLINCRLCCKFMFCCEPSSFSPQISCVIVRNFTDCLLLSDLPRSRHFALTHLGKVQKLTYCVEAQRFGSKHLFGFANL